MANVKFTQLTQTLSAGIDDILPIVTVDPPGDGLNKKITINTLAQVISSYYNFNTTTGYVPLSGNISAMTGYLILNADPVIPFHASTKQYVDGRINALSAFADTKDLPIGSVLYFAASTAPIGWFECDGRSLNTASFPDLFTAIGYTYGGGGASFNLPDLRGEFLRGWDRSSTQGARGVDSGRVFGTSQLDQFQGHWHEIYAAASSAAGSINNSSNGVPSVPLPADRVRNPVTDGTNGSPRTGSETRPRNVAMLPCIKYSSTSQVTQVGLSAQTILNYVTSVSALIPNSKSVAKAWVAFTGLTTTPQISASYNVSGVTKNATGWYTVTFTTPMANNKYYVVSQSTGDPVTNSNAGTIASSSVRNGCDSIPLNFTTASIDVATSNQGDGGTTLTNVPYVSIMVFTE